MDTTVTWSLIYAAMLDGLDLSKTSFQLVYPFTSWTWPTTAPGYVSAAQYDFCATMPQWSGVGRYNSSGIRFNDSYGNFLSVLTAKLASPELQREITRQQGVVQLAKNDYDMAYSQATGAYLEAVGGNNLPTFTEWLGTPDGKPWAALLDQRWNAYVQEGQTLEALVEQSKDLALQEAMAAFKDPKTYVKYQDPGLAGFPQVPGWCAAMSPAEWLQKVYAGEIPGAEFTFSMKEPPYDYNQTWAGRSLPVTSALFAVSEDEVWRPLTPEEEKLIATVTVSLKAWSLLDIVPYGWYSPAFVVSRSEGPFLKGYSGNPDGSPVYLWGEGGAMDLKKTGMMVAYQPSFTITPVEGADARSILGRSAQTNALTGFRVGPLVQEAAAPQRLSDGRLALQAQDLDNTSNVPQIFGVRVEMLPGLNPTL
jgi:hypothetical protein